MGTAGTGGGGGTGEPEQSSSATPVHTDCLSTDQTETLRSNPVIASTNSTLEEQAMKKDSSGGDPTEAVDPRPDTGGIDLNLGNDGSTHADQDSDYVEYSGDEDAVIIGEKDGPVDDLSTTTTWINPEMDVQVSDFEYSSL